MASVLSRSVSSVAPSIWVCPEGLGPDVLYRGRGGGGGQRLHRAEKSGLSGAVGQVVLDIALVQQGGGGGGVAGGEGLDQGEGLFGVRHGGCLRAGAVFLGNVQGLAYIDEIGVLDGAPIGLVEAGPLRSAAKPLPGDFPKGVSRLYDIFRGRGRDGQGQRQGRRQRQGSELFGMFHDAFLL